MAEGEHSYSFLRHGWWIKHLLCFQHHQATNLGREDSERAVSSLGMDVAGGVASG